MHPRLFRLLEKHQRIDERLRAAQQRPALDGREINQLMALKAKVKRLINGFALRPALASA